MYHIPVLLAECIEGLNIKPDGVYVDVTFGGGGHSKAILEKLGEKGRLYAFDQDEDARRNIPEDSRLIFIPQNFRYIQKFLRLEGVRGVDGVLADLGVSSHQFDEGERGFSFRFEAELDMRMNQEQPTSAQTILNSYNAIELQRVLGEFGEVRNARTLAQAIVKEREMKPFVTIGDFLRVLRPLIIGKDNRYLAQVFQALRMEVNDEVNALKDMLTQVTELLNPEGRLVVMSYHSIEDRLVKNLMKKGNCEGIDVTDFYGNRNVPLKTLTSKPIEPSEADIEENPRARSAKLRIAKK